MNYPFKDGKDRPTLVCSIGADNAPEVIATMRNAVYDGADAFLLHMEKLKPEYRNKKALEEIISYSENKTVLTLDYRMDGKTDEESAAMLLESIDAGADCIDVFADMFDARDVVCYTNAPEAVKKQKELIAAAHEKGAQVLSSVHIFEFAEPEKVLDIALDLEARGADIVKVAAQVNSERQLVEGIRLTNMMRENLKVPFLHICMGQYGKAHRMIAPLFGSSMILCVQKYTEYSHKDKPLLRAAREVYNNIDYKRFRR